MLHLKCTKMLPLFLLVFLHHHKGYVSVICYAGRLVELDTKRHAMIRTNGSSVSPWGKQHWLFAAVLRGRRGHKSQVSEG